MMDAQRSILRRKIAAAEARTMAESARGAEAGAMLASVLENYFGVALRPSALHCRLLDKARVRGLSLRGGWFRFRRGETDIIVALDDALVAAAVNAALLRPLAGVSACAPTAIDRSIASALARRIADALAPASEEIAIISTAALAGELRLDNAAAQFDLFEARGIPLAPSLRVEIICGIGTPEKARKAPASPHPTDWSERLAGIALKTEVALDARLGVAPTTIGGMIELAPGMVLPIEEAAIDKLRLAARGRQQTVLTGKLGALRGRRAVRIGT